MINYQLEQIINDSCLISDYLFNQMLLQFETNKKRKKQFKNKRNENKNFKS